MRWPQKHSLLTLVWASSAFASRIPFVGELLERSLPPRSDASLQARQSDSLCPDSYTSRNGANYTTYCGQNNPGNDARAKFETSDFVECMEHCSRYWGEGEGCFGVSWRASDRQCWLRTSNTTKDGLEDLEGHHSALVGESVMQPLDEDCPAEDLSTHSLDGYEGIGYTVHCGKVIGGYDACWEGYPSCWNSPYRGFYHAESLEECLRYCIDEHPLCRAVSYNPGLEIGYANCWPKTDFANKINSPDNDMGVLHTAAITNLDPVDGTCPEQDTHSAAGGDKEFAIHCGQLNTGTNITSLHAQNITVCMNECAANENGCVGVVFDSRMHGGYRNCYLQNTTSVIVDQESSSYAILSDTPIPSSTPSGGSDSGSGSSSQAWIAGPVIGGIAGVALITGAIFWWRRRKAKAAGAAAGGASLGEHGIEKDGNPYMEATYSQNGYHNVPQGHGLAEADGVAQATELPVTTKYARTQAQEPQELP